MTRCDANAPNAYGIAAALLGLLGNISARTRERPADMTHDHAKRDPGPKPTQTRPEPHRRLRNQTRREPGPCRHLDTTLVRQTHDLDNPRYTRSRQPQIHTPAPKVLSPTQTSVGPCCLAGRCANRYRRLAAKNAGVRNDERSVHQGRTSLPARLVMSRRIDRSAGHSSGRSRTCCGYASGIRWPSSHDGMSDDSDSRASAARRRITHCKTLANSSPCSTASSSALCVCGASGMRDGGM